MEIERSKIIGIVAHSFEGGSLCFLTTCLEGGKKMGPHMHPTVVLSAIPMGLSMPGWESDNHQEVGKFLKEGVEQVAKAGAEFYVCPDNTAHIVLEKVADQLPLPGLSIADVVCSEIVLKGWKKVGLLGTKWTMNGSVYEQALKRHELEKLIPNTEFQQQINEAIFEELCQGVFKPDTTQVFIDAIEELKSNGAECVILGCTEIPLIITPENSPLPTLDSTRLLAKYAGKMNLSMEERFKSIMDGSNRLVFLKST